MSHVIGRCLGEDDHVTLVGEGVFPSFCRQDDFDCSLKRPWGILTTERHLNKMKEILMGGEGRLVAILLLDFDLPVATLSVKCRKDGSISQGVNAFVHTWYWVSISHTQCV